jgi:hypothetical protein
MENGPKYVTHNGKFSTFILIIQKVLHVDVNVSADLSPVDPVVSSKQSTQTQVFLHSIMLTPSYCVHKHFVFRW